MATRTNTSSTTGEQIEDALSIIEENGGTGEWETTADEDQPDIPRWLFPRFPGATDPGDQYLSRSGLGANDTDVETICSLLAAPRNIVGGVLLEGDPGTGKTALVEAAATHAGVELTTHVATPDDTRESLLLRFVGEGNGENGGPFVKGVLPEAATKPGWFYCDEFFLTADGVKPVYYQFLDGRHVLSGGNVDGSDLEIHPDFRMIVSSNPLVRGASLPEPIGSRFAGATITVETSPAMLKALGIDESIVAAWETLKVQGLWYPAIREMRVADYWLPVDPTQAVSAFLPAHCPESQRAQIRDIVVSHLGGDIRSDGRLVVS